MSETYYSLVVQCVEIEPGCHRDVRPRMRPTMVRRNCSLRLSTDAGRPKDFHNLRLSFHGITTVGVHERERSPTNSGPPGSRSRHLGIKTNFQNVSRCRSDRACRCFSNRRVVLCRSRRVALQKYEAYSQNCFRKIKFVRSSNRSLHVA